MKKKNTKLGDVFCVTWSTSNKKYLQYVVSDLTQLNSDVIRIFKKTCSTDDHPSVDEIVNDEVDFYAHCVTKRGVELNLWQVAGNTNKVGTTRILFRDSNDYGDPEIVISENWVVWEVNQEQRYVGKLLGENRKADIGIVFPPHLIIERIKNGRYDFVYPSFD